MWIEAGEKTKDVYAAFRGRLALEREAHVEIRTLGASWFVAWLDGDPLTEGPARFPVAHPEYDTTCLQLDAGQHLLAVQVHHVGETTRMMPDMAPFWWCQVRVDGRELPVAWRARRLAGYRSQVRRINPILGWIEWQDTRADPPNWRSVTFDDLDWAEPIEPATHIQDPKPPSIGPVRQFTHPLEPIAAGSLAETFGSELDDVAARFFLRDLTCDKLPSQGLWRRYDLGRVRLGRPRFLLDLPEGAIVEFAYAETLSHHRVAPYITLSSGPSCNLDHYVARGGPQEFAPLTPKGGRYLELHILADPERIRFSEQTYLERCYHGPPDGEFSCGDPLLDRIWAVGVETYRACCEDALVDNPTRERGQWTGDAVSVGMDIAAAAYADLRLLRRTLVQSAQCSRDDGLVAGLSPGTVIHIATYASQWVAACVHFHELTGDRALLETLYPAAERNLSAYERFLTDDGLTDGAGWVFVDWGYVRNEGPADVAYNLHYLAAVRAMIRWCALLDRPEDVSRYRRTAQRVERALRAWIDARLAHADEGWDVIGYHVAVLALRLGLIDERHLTAGVAAIKRHILRCFPNDPTAPRLSAPDRTSRQLITPYFAHDAMTALIERGEMDFVLDQYRTCWGWALQDDRTTWVEVFDTRWSHCHQWAGAPTWQLSRYVLGLQPRFDLGPCHYLLDLHPGSLERATGSLPIPGIEGTINVDWTREPGAIRYTLVPPTPIWLHLPEPHQAPEAAKVIRIASPHELRIAQPR